ncbi:MAG: RluA family pseudouridine synthase [Oscillospiraceae bacterium]|nr:RluA family pseudouridine synthase [Oscillospiraceae bacterium]
MYLQQKGTAEEPLPFAINYVNYMPEDIKVKILFSDRWLVLCEKPVGVTAEEGMTKLLAENGFPGCYCVHRLDQTVGGVCLYARDGKTAAELSQMFASHEIEKKYLAVVTGTPEQKLGTMQDLLFHDRQKNKTYVVARKRNGVKEAVLNYNIMSTHNDGNIPMSLAEIQLETGRSHQIRVQFASRKMPLCGDVKYGSVVRNCTVALYCKQLSFVHPKTGEKLTAQLLPKEEFPWNLFQTELYTEK